MRKTQILAGATPEFIDEVVDGLDFALIMAVRAVEGCAPVSEDMLRDEARQLVVDVVSGKTQMPECFGFQAFVDDGAVVLQYVVNEVTLWPKKQNKTKKQTPQKKR